MKYGVMKRLIFSSLILATVILGSITSAPAADDIVVSHPNQGFLSHSLYLGAGLGNASYDELNDSDVAFSLFGGIDINEVLAVEAGWTDLGEASKGGNKTSADTLSVGILGKLPLSTDISLFGKVGMARWNYDATISGVSDSASSTDLYYGFGANYDISGQSSVRFGLDLYSMKPGISGISSRDDINMFFVGFTYRP